MEQLAFAPSHMVPGIEPSPDKMLQARLFSYADTHRHRLGVNYQSIPVNCPYASRFGVHNYQRDGGMQMKANSAPNYFPNRFVLHEMYVCIKYVANTDGRTWANFMCTSTFTKCT